MIKSKVKHFQILGPIGHGGMGDVFLAEDTRLNRNVALKFLAQQFCKNDSFRTRFIREAQAAAALSHPNIITIYEVDTWDGRPFLAMRYLPGGRLSDLTKSGDPGLKKRLDIALQITSGLSAAHDAGVIHRDLKPSNILFDENGKAVITDFGLAKLVGEESITSRSARLGTPSYMSPEQALGKHVDKRSDIFSLGVLLYELFCGETPFQGEYEPAICYSIVYEEPVHPEQVNSKVSSAIARIILRALEKDLQDRYQTVADLHSDLLLAQVGKDPAIASEPPQSQPRVSHSIAALPVRNLGSADDEHLAHGFTEELIVALTRQSCFRVTPLNRVLQFSDFTSAQEISEALGVDLIVDGSLKRIGKSVSLLLSLIDVGAGVNRWACKKDTTLQCLSDLAEELTREMVSTIGVKTQPPRRSGRSFSEIDPHAFENYLRGKHRFERKQDESDIAVASGFFHKAIEVEPGLLEAQCGLAETLIHQGQYEEALRALTTALETSGAQTEARAPALRLLARACERLSRWDEALEFAMEAREISVGRGDLKEEAEALAVIIQVRLRRAELSEALRLQERALEIAHELGDKHGVGEALRKLGNVYLRQGAVDEALELYERALKIGRQLNDLALQAHCLHGRSQAYSQESDYEAASREAREALALHQQLGDRAGQAGSLNILALVDMFLGEFELAIQRTEEALEIFESLGVEGDRALCLNNIGYLHCVLGNYQVAHEKLQEAFQLAEKINYPLIRVAAQRFRGCVFLREGQSDQAHELMVRALKVGRDCSLKGENSITLADLAECAYAGGRYQACVEYADESLSSADEAHENAAGIKARAYKGAALCHLADSQSGFAELELSLTLALKLRDPIISILAHRLAGEVFSKYAGTAERKVRGRKLLEEALALARRKKVQYEIEWINALIQ